MRADRPSRTAAWVALWRGIGGFERDAVVRDPVARDLVPQPYRAVLDAAALAPRATGAALAAIHFLGRDRFRHLPLRTRAIDDAVCDAVAKGARQLVILGAGLDARAWRLGCLRDVRVFEVDHPATQAYKRERIGSRAPAAREVVFVGVDFERQNLAERLAESGQDASTPTVFVWEGVTMYLTRPAIEATLAAVAERSAAGSRIAVTYQRDVGYRALGLVVRLAREPFASYLEPAEIRALLEARGFRVEGDTSDPEWAERYLGRKKDDWAVERLCIARRPSESEAPSVRRR